VSRSIIIVVWKILAQDGFHLWVPEERIMILEVAKEQGVS
jgi:hypothetical protein